jgi:hypothetical protein
MIKMLGIFNLVPTESMPRYRAAFEAFSQHLYEVELLESWAVFSRHPHNGYDAMPPDQSCLVEMHFKDSIQAQACYDYVEADQEPLQSLHRTMNKKVTNTIFALYEKAS